MNRNQRTNGVDSLSFLLHAIQVVQDKREDRNMNLSISIPDPGEGLFSHIHHVGKDYMVVGTGKENDEGRVTIVSLNAPFVVKVAKRVVDAHVKSVYNRDRGEAA